jgi:hypothetical protein
MTHETKRQEASREAREDEAEQALQDDLDLEEVEGDQNDEETAMTSATKKHDEYQPGDEVTVNVEGQELDGVVRSVQLSKGLVDVQVYKHGHMKHGLTLSLPPDQVSARHAKGKSA